MPSRAVAAFVARLPRQKLIEDTAIVITNIHALDRRNTFNMMTLCIIITYGFRNRNHMKRYGSTMDDNLSECNNVWDN